MERNIPFEEVSIDTAFGNHEYNSLKYRKIDENTRQLIEQGVVPVILFNNGEVFIGCPRRDKFDYFLAKWKVEGKL
jgi:hypothetical protein